MCKSPASALWKPARRAGRYARNPRTGERVRVKEATVPRFHAGQG
ncbi:HU family DNA-binding protein [Kitasatospora indigofera]